MFGIQKFTDSVNGMRLPKDRVLRASLSGNVVYINFFNLPKKVSDANKGGGAERENNRMLFTVESHRGVTVTVKQLISLHKAPKFKSKTAFPDKILQYLDEYLTRVVNEVEPNFTHTKALSA